MAGGNDKPAQPGNTLGAGHTTLYALPFDLAAWRHRIRTAISIVYCGRQRKSRGGAGTRALEKLLRCRGRREW